MSKRKLFRSVVALVTGLLLMFSTMTVGFAATTTPANPTTIYATSTDGKTLQFNFTDLFNAYATGNTAYITAWTSVKSIDIVVVNGVNVDYSAFFADFAAQKVASLADYAAQAGAKTLPTPELACPVAAAGTVGPAVVLVPLSITSVSANNLFEINVTFNKAVDATSAEDPASYTLSAGDVDAAVLSGNTVTLTLDAKVAQQASLTVTVAGVKDLNGLTMATTKKSVSFLDVAVPTVVSAVITGPQTLKVTYSEPIDELNLGTYTVDNNTYSTGVPVAVDGDTHSVNVPLGAILPAGTHTLSVSAAKDYAGFTVSSVNVTFSYEKDTVAPTVSLVSASQNKVTIKFSKPITIATEANLSVYHTYNNNPAYAAANNGALTTNDHQTYTATFNKNYLPLGTATVYVNAGADSTTVAKDQWGNAFASTTLTASVSADTTAPTVVSVTAISSTQIDVQYSKAVTGADVTANYTLKDASGSAVAVNNAAVDGIDNTLYHLTTATLNGGSYTLAFANIKDTSLAQNAMAAYTATVSVKDLIPPTIGTAVTNASDATATKILLSYSEAMATTGAASVLEATNYLFDGVAIPSGTTITSADNGKTVLFTFPSARQIDAKNLVIGHVSDVAGNYVAAMSTTVAVAADTIAAIAKASAINTTTVTFEVAQPLSSIDVSKFTVGGAAATTANYVNQLVSSGTVNGALVTLTVASADKWATSATPAINITAGAFKSTFGTACSGIGPVAAADKMAPSLVSAEVTAAGTITLTYSEDIKASSVSVYTYTVPSNTVTASSVAGEVVTLTLGTNLTGTDATTTVTQALEIQDNSAASNKLAPSAAVDVADAQAPTFTATITGAKEITVVFSEKVDETDAETIGNYVYDPGAGAEAIVSATLQADGKTVKLVTTTAPAAGSSTIDATVEDLSGNTSVSAVIAL